MPDLNTAVSPADPGMEDDEPALRREPAPGQLSREEKRAAVDNILALMGASRPGTAPDAAPADAVGTTGGGRAPAAPMLPTARTRRALDQLVEYGTVETLEEARIDVKTLCRDLFDWDTPQQSRATKTVVKTVARVLLARTDTGVSLYPAAVEMLSLAAAAAPMLEPDRLARLIAEAPKVTTAFKPEPYTMQLAAALRTIVGRYHENPARQEQLLVSLWNQSHTGRWWDMTSGVVAVRTGHRRTKDEDEQQRRADAEAAVRSVLAGAAEGTKKAHQVVATALVNGDLVYSDATVRLVRALPEFPRVADKLAIQFEKLSTGETIDPDVALLASHLPWLAPRQRPETPLTWLLKTLVVAITPDPETGEAAVDEMPDKPREFADLFPLAELLEFPFPPSVRDLDKRFLTGIAGEKVLIDLIVNPMLLAKNRDYMGNCTWSYKARLEKAEAVLLALWRGKDCYNAALRRSGPSWTVGEINSRHNNGNVPADIVAGVHQLAASLPDPGPAPEVSTRRRRHIRYAVQ